MARGRKPKPTAEKIAQGNPGRRPLNDKEPKPSKVVPDCPGHLDKVAKREWARIAKELSELGILTKLDGVALALYCQNFSRWVQAEKALKSVEDWVEHTNNRSVPSGYLNVSERAQQAMFRYLSEFGMTPVARTRIVVEHVKEEEPMMTIEEWKRQREEKRKAQEAEAKRQASLNNQRS